MEFSRKNTGVGCHFLLQIKGARPYLSVGTDWKAYGKLLLLHWFVVLKLLQVIRAGSQLGGNAPWEAEDGKDQLEPTKEELKLTSISHHHNPQWCGWSITEGAHTCSHTHTYTGLRCSWKGSKLSCCPLPRRSSRPVTMNEPLEHLAPTSFFRG